ncbi:MAG: flagellar basal-body MS-ring/collar protein FliF [Saccharospirillum sp.]
MTENVPAATRSDLSADSQASGALPARGERRATAATERADMVEQDGPAATRVHPLVAGFNKLPMMRQFGLLIGLAASIALGLGVVLWSQNESYRPLMSSTSTYAAADIIDVLQANGITFDIDPGSGVILVRQSDLHQARLAIAGAGLSNDQTVGYELLDQDQPLGTSQFMESARYMRSLEGELARTIASINQVRSARVHLAIPERSVFVRDRRHPSASVFIDLQAGGELNNDMVRAIRNLVATSIPELQPDNVSLVDQRGRLLSDQPETAEEELTARQFEYSQRVEESLLSRVNSILSPVVGANRFRAEVTADIDFTRVEQAEEFYNPDLIALRSEQTIEEQRVGDPQGGVPGALTNQPPGAAEAPEEAGAEGEAAAPPTSSRSEATRNFEVDRTLSYTQFQQGRVRRLTVAVVVDDLRRLNPETGQVEVQEWTEQDLQRLRVLVQDAVGFDASRGDSINVVHSSFLGEEPTFEEQPWYSQPWFWDIARQILAGLFVLILVFGLLRPAVRSLLNKGEQGRAEEDDALAALDVDEDAIADDKVTLSTVDEYHLPGPSESFERQIDALRGLIAEDPGRVALVLKRWIMNND